MGEIEKTQPLPLGGYAHSPLGPFNKKAGIYIAKAGGQHQIVLKQSFQLKLYNMVDEVVRTADLSAKMQASGVGSDELQHLRGLLNPDSDGEAFGRAGIEDPRILEMLSLIAQLLQKHDKMHRETSKSLDPVMIAARQIAVERFDLADFKPDDVVVGGGFRKDSSSGWMLGVNDDYGFYFRVGTSGDNHHQIYLNVEHNNLSSPEARVLPSQLEVEVDGKPIKFLRKVYVNSSYRPAGTMSYLPAGTILSKFMHTVLPTGEPIVVRVRVGEKEHTITYTPRMKGPAAAKGGSGASGAKEGKSDATGMGGYTVTRASDVQKGLAPTAAATQNRAKAFGLQAPAAAAIQALQAMPAVIPMAEGATTVIKK